MAEKLNIVVIGAGNVGHHLALALAEKHRISAIVNRTPEHAKPLATELGCPAFADVGQIPSDTDVILLAVKDEAVGEIAQRMGRTTAVVAHTSGSIPLNALIGSSERTGVFYPLQTMHKNSEVNMRQVPFCIEGSDPNTEELLLSLARDISDNVQVLNSEQRRMTHVAAVFACNFTNHFYAIAEELLEQNGMGLDILRPLIRKTAGNVEHDRPKNLQTGPAKRNDTQVMHEHLHILRSISPEWEKLYQDMSESIRRLHRE